MNAVTPHPCGVCGTEHNKEHCPSCGAHPWEGCDAREEWPDVPCGCSSWGDERDSAHFEG